MPRKRRKRRSDWLRALIARVILATLLGIAYARINVPPETRHGFATTAPRTDWAAQLPASIEAIGEALRRLPLQLPAPELRPRGAGKVRWIQQHYDVALPVTPEPDVVRAWFNTIEEAAPATGAKITDTENGVEVLIGVDGLLTHTLSLHWPGRQSRVAIVLTGLGNDLRLARDASNLGLSLTLAIDAHAPFAAQVRDLGKLSSADVLASTSTRVEEQASPSALDSYVEQIRQARQVLPEAIGIASTLTTIDLDESGRQALLGLARQLELFVLDTTGDICTLAAEAGDCLGRDIAIDAGASPEAMRLALESTIPLAQTRGDVIVVGHAEPALFEALRQALPQLQAAHIQVVPLSRLAADRRSLSLP